MSKKLQVFIMLSLSISLYSYDEGSSYYDYVNVTQSIPIYKTIIERKPYKDCYNVNYKAKVDCYSDETTNNRDNNSIGLDTIIGATAGVILGNQFHNHKDASRVIGGLAGGLMANNMRNQDSGDCYENKTKRKCVTKYKEEEKNILTKYKNIGYFNGREIIKYSERPINQIRIKINY